MDWHVRQVGIWNIVFGLVSLVCYLTLLLNYGGIYGIYLGIEDYILAVLLIGGTIFHLIISVPCVIGGFFLLQYKDWARSALIVTSALNVLNPPLGSILGAYGLWVLMAPEIEPLFSDPLPHIKAKYAVKASAEVAENTAPANPQILPSGSADATQ